MKEAFPQVRKKRVHFGPPLTHYTKDKRGFSSAGRAPALQAGGQRFDPANLHQDSKEFKRLTEVPWKQDASLSFLKLKTCTLKTEHCEL